jgi:hypothetical protein
MSLIVHMLFPMMVVKNLQKWCCVDLLITIYLLITN